MTMTKLELTKEQQEAVDHDTGAALVFAGAGSGKTRVVTERYCRLIESGVSVSRVLVATFTNKAADELLARLNISRRRRDVWVGTFHSMCVRWLRMCEPEHRAGRNASFTIYDEKDQESLLRKILREVAKEPEFENVKPSDVAEWISKQKNEGTMLEKFVAGNELAAFYRRVWSEYEDELQTSNAFDFDDLLLYAANAVESQSPSGAKLRGMYDHVMVDEYQDVNDVQARIVKGFASMGNLVVVGDVHQSVYAFRGANPENIRRFTVDFPGAKVVMLDTCFRSTGMIVACCNSLIAANPPIEGRTAMKAVKPAGSPVCIVSHRGSGDEVQRTIDDIEEKLRHGVPPYEMAIEYRVHSLSAEFERELRFRGIKYSIAGTKFYDRAVVKDVLAHARLIVNQDSEVDFDRVVNKPSRKVGKVAIQKLNFVSKKRECSRYVAIDKYTSDLFDIPSQTVSALVSWTQDFVHARSMLSIPSAKASEVVKQLIEDTGYMPMLRRECANSQGKDKRTAESAYQELANAEAVVTAITGYEKRHDAPAMETIEGYLQEAALVDAQDDLEEGRLWLLSCHASKGREFDYVWLVGVEEGLFPISLAVTRREVEEERRLLYVGMSRARKELTLSYCSWRERYGKYVDTNPSPMLEDLDESTVVRL